MAHDHTTYTDMVSKLTRKRSFFQSKTDRLGDTLPIAGSMVQWNQRQPSGPGRGSCRNCKAGIFVAIVQMNVQGLMVDPYNRAYIILLKDREESELLPIWVGTAEANAIGRVLEEGDASPRPMTHDLLHTTIKTLGARTLSVVIHDLKENTFYAKVHLLHGDGEVTVDARPSDAIALALRADCPVFVDTSVFDKSRTSEVAAWLKNLKPEDFGRADETP